MALARKPQTSRADGGPPVRSIRTDNGIVLWAASSNASALNKGKARISGLASTMTCGSPLWKNATIAGFDRDRFRADHAGNQRPS